MKKKFILIASLLLALCLLVTSCGTGSGEKDPSKTADPANPTENPAEPTQAPDDGSMKISIVDDRNEEKVITEEKFKVPSSLKANGGKFTVSVIYLDNMVLQANMYDRIFGKYSGSDKYVGAQLINDETKESRTFYGEVKDGEFEIWLGKTDYGGPYTLSVFDSEGSSVTYKNILFGEVYILGGQSNMGWALGQCYDGTTSKNLYQDLINNTHNDNVRWMAAWPVSSTEYVDYLTSCQGWQSATPQNVPSWNAVGYFFAMRMNELYDVPIGIIGSCMGGTSIDKWYTEEDSGIWYRGVTHPFRKLTVRGVCWYQGEGDFKDYAERLEKLINQWRVAFENPNLYWAAVQLPRYENADSYYQCREEVKSVYGKVSNYTYCVTLDTGLYPEFAATGDTLNADGIHPYDKLKVGERLADSCAHDFYGAEGTYTSPVAISAKVQGDKVLITFDNVGEGMTVVGLKYGFEVSGKDRKYHDAVPEVVAPNQILLSCEDVTSNFYGVRYGRKNYRQNIYGEQIKSAADSACCYNTVNGEAAYPLEQFVFTKIS